ncbi:MAG: hypothetical protein K0S01_1741 [Herbinix sp.]|jgi:diguanylate cyclase (GGDEF)-like protein|nr:hypothetical protein [Herbinix sp.]
MFGNERKTIGVFVTQLHQEFQETLSRGICKRAKELGYNVAFFTNFLGYGEFQYEIGERSIALLPSYEDLDGIIILPDTMFVQGFDKCIREHIKDSGRCPVVSVRQRIEEYYNVLIEDTSVLDEIIHHFIVDHGYKKINFLTGPRDNLVSIERLEAYKRIMKEHDITVNEDQMYYGDFWKLMGYDAVRYWLSDPEKRPEAIICANDYMAATVCSALAERGISVPEDIAVSGCDNMAITEDFNPSITTAGIPIFEMGIEAVEKLHKHNMKIPQDKNSYLSTVTTLRESCGCKVNSNRNVMTKRRNRLISEMEEKEKDISNNAFMSVELTNVKLIDELDRKLASYTYMNEGFESFYMCLHKDWELFSNENPPELSSLTNMVMEVGIKKGEWLQKEDFSKQSLLPTAHVGRDPQIFIFNMLHYQEVCFGYTAISFYNGAVYKPSYQGWLINICNALENIRIHNELKRLVYKLEDMYIKDEMTGLYNRRALVTLGQKYMKQSIDEHSDLMVFTADMDKLKFINDNFGHACGDIAIKVVSNALLYAAEDDEICMRVGGDEYVVIGLDYDQRKMNHFVNRFEEEIDRYNREAGSEYKVYVSYGWSIIKPNETTTIEDCLIVADAKMYQQKYEKEALRLKHRSEFRELDGKR